MLRCLGDRVENAWGTGLGALSSCVEVRVGIDRRYPVWTAAKS